MPWDGGLGAGVTTGRPWLAVGEANLSLNVTAQRDDPGSMLNLHRRLLRLRHQTPALVIGAHEPLEADGDVLAHLRGGRGKRYLVALNLGPSSARLAIHGWIVPAGSRPPPTRPVRTARSRASSSWPVTRAS
jgi:alpha-glucosidase